MITDQPMRISVTVETPAMLTVNDLAVRQAMALLASQRRGVLSLVAVDTIDAAMVGFGCSKIFGGLFMANPALRGRHIPDRNDHQRLVGGMTTPAIRLGLGRLVRLVAIQAARDFFMLGMTAVAEQPGMPAGCRCHPLSDFAVT
jgi:hypothetical protein